MSALGDGTFEAGIEGITGEESQDGRLAGESGIGSVVVHDRLEARDSADWLCRSRSSKVSRIAAEGGARTRHGTRRCNGLTGGPDDLFERTNG